MQNLVMLLTTRLTRDYIAYVKLNNEICQLWLVSYKLIIATLVKTLDQYIAADRHQPPPQGAGALCQRQGGAGK